MEEPVRPREFALADRRFGRSLLIGLAVLAAIGGVGPLLAYRNDVAIGRHQLQRRVESEAALAAEFLSLHLEVCAAELERVAQRPEIDLHDQNFSPEQTLLVLAHHDSVLFSGVALLDSGGHPLWSEPSGLLAEGNVHATRWFQRVLEGEPRVVDAIRPGHPSFVVAIPVLRKGRLTGVIVGLLDASDRLLPNFPRPGGEMAVVGPAGEVLFPDPPPTWLNAPGKLQRLLDTLKDDATALDVEGRMQSVAARPVGRTGLSLVLLADMAQSQVVMRERFLQQLAFTVGLQLVTLLLVTLSLRSTYRRFLQADLAVAEQKTLTALGTAAALIAHEVKNALNGLHAATSTLAAERGTDLGVSAIQGQVDRLAHLARSLLSFGNPSTPKLAPVRVDEVVRGAMEGLRVHPEWSEVELELTGADPVTALADPFFLLTALDNLLRNAIEATVAAKDLGSLKAPRIEVRVARERETAVITVEDHAGGPPPGFEEQRYAPFVTSKARGIGLGLAMVHRAAHQQGGALVFERTPDGSRFALRLRVAPEVEAT